MEIGLVLLSMNARRWPSRVAPLSLMCVLFACSSGEVSQPGVNGDAAGADVLLPQDAPSAEDAPMDSGRLVECQPQNGETAQPAGYYPWTALPEGHCDGSVALCSIEIDMCCNVGPSGEISGYTCSCSNGTWNCTVSSPGAGGCNELEGGLSPYCVADPDASDGGRAGQPEDASLGPEDAPIYVPDGGVCGAIPDADDGLCRPSTPYVWFCPGSSVDGLEKGCLGSTILSSDAMQGIWFCCP